MGNLGDKAVNRFFFISIHQYFYIQLAHYLLYGSVVKPRDVVKRQRDILPQGIFLVHYHPSRDKLIAAFKRKAAHETAKKPRLDIITAEVHRNMGCPLFVFACYQYDGFHSRPPYALTLKHRSITGS